MRGGAKWLLAGLVLGGVAGCRAPTQPPAEEVARKLTALHPPGPNPIQPPPESRTPRPQVSDYWKGALAPGQGLAMNNSWPSPFGQAEPLIGASPLLHNPALAREDTFGAGGPQPQSLPGGTSQQGIGGAGTVRPSAREQFQPDPVPAAPGDVATENAPRH